MSRLDPSVAAVRAAVRRVLAAEQDTPEPAPMVAVACSGGPDSLALAAATAFVAPRLGLPAAALIVDHGWSAGSAQVAAQVAERCRGLGLDPARVLTAGPDPLARGGPEAAARRVRYLLLEQAATDLEAAHRRAVVVLLGHTLDDQAETVLLGLARGSGARSLAAMAAARGRYRRPLLALPREQTLAACRALGLTWWDDPANADPRYRRVRVRELMPELVRALGPGVPAALARTADQLAEDAQALDELAERLLGAAADRPGLSVEVLRAAPAAIRRRALLLAARQAGSPPGSLGRVHVLALDSLITTWHGQGPLDLPGSLLATRSCGRLWFATRPREKEPDGRR